MSRRSVYILGGVFATLVALTALTRFWLSRPALPAKPPVSLAGMTATSVDRIILRSPDASTILVRDGSLWRVQGSAPTTPGARPATRPAEMTQVNALFETLKKARFERLVTREADDPAAYGLATSTARWIVVMTGETTRLALKIGDPSDAPGSDYVQAPGDQAVWTLSGGLRDAADPSSSVWFEKPKPSGSATGTVGPSTGTAPPPQETPGGGPASGPDPQGGSPPGAP